MDKNALSKKTLEFPPVTGATRPNPPGHASMGGPAFDQAYIQYLIQGDRATEMHFFTYFGDLLVIKLRSRLASMQLVEALRQDTFVQVLTELRLKGGLDTPGSLGAFVNSVCNDVLLAFYRSQTRPRDEKPDVDSALVTEECKQEIEAVLQGFSERDRTLLRMIYCDNRDKAWICQNCHVDRKYLHVLIHSAKARFRDARSGILTEFETPARVN